MVFESVVGKQEGLGFDVTRPRRELTLALTVPSVKESDLRKGNDSDSEDSVDLDHLSSDDEADEQARQANKPKVATGSKGGGVSLSGGLGNGVSTMAIEEEDENR